MEQQSPSTASLGKRKATEQREEVEEELKSSFGTVTTTLPTSTPTTDILPKDERGENEPHSDNAPERDDDVSSGSTSSKYQDKGIKQQKSRQRRSETGITSTAQVKGKQRSLEEEHQERLLLPIISSQQQKQQLSSTSKQGTRIKRSRTSQRRSGPSSSSTEDKINSRQEISGSSRRISSTSTTPSASPPLQGFLAVSSTMTEKDSRRYLLHILQQPTIGCAFGSNVLSRLAIAPPLIVQVQAIDRAGREIILDQELPFLICRVKLNNEEGKPVDMLTATSSSKTTSSSVSSESTSTNTTTTTTSSRRKSVRLLYGTLVASPMQLYTQDNRSAIIFVFPEISIRSRGRFQLEVSLNRLPLPSLGSMTGGTIATASTESFNIVLYADYNAPDVTDITRHFARQGVGLLLPPEQAQSGPTAD